MSAPTQHSRGSASARKRAEQYSTDYPMLDAEFAVVQALLAVCDSVDALAERLAPPTVEAVPGDEVETAARLREAFLRTRTVGPRILGPELRVAPLGFTAEQMASLHRMVAEWDEDNAVDGTAADYSAVADHVGDQTDEDAYWADKGDEVEDRQGSRCDAGEHDLRLNVAPDGSRLCQRCGTRVLL